MVVPLTRRKIISSLIDDQDDEEDDENGVKHWLVRARPVVDGLWENNLTFQYLRVSLEQDTSCISFIEILRACVGLESLFFDEKSRGAAPCIGAATTWLLFRRRSFLLPDRILWATFQKDFEDPIDFLVYLLCLNWVVALSIGTGWLGINFAMDTKYKIILKSIVTWICLYLLHD